MNHRTRTQPGRPASTAGWPVPAALIALSAIPLTFGTLRLVELAGGPAVMPADERFTGFPVALALHVAGSAVYALVGAFQFAPRFRRQRPAWHRRVGRLVAVVGLAVAGSALWLTLFYARHPGTGDLLYGARLVVAPAMAAFLVLGFAAIRRRDIAAHRAWMIRAFALGLGAGTQVLTEGFGGALLGTDGVRGDVLKLAAWVINLGVAEWAIRRPARRRARRPLSIRASGTHPARARS